jgi:hypothetical protein
MTSPDLASIAFMRSHPLIRLALGDQTLRRRLWRVQTQLHKLIDTECSAALTTAAQHEAVNSLRYELPQLGLSPEDTRLFERDLFRLLAHVLPQPVRLQDLFVMELQLCRVAVEPAYWWTGDFLPADLPFPRLVDTQRPSGATANVFFPSICSEAADTARDLAAAALADDSIQAWPIRHCEIVLRLMVMNSLLGTSGGDLRSIQAGYDCFEGVEMKLWDNLAVHIDWQANPDATPLLWERDLRNQVLLELRPRSRLVGAALPKARPSAKGLNRAGANEPIDSGSAFGEQPSKDGTSAKPPAGYMRVITTPIPPATHKDDQDTIAQYAPLREGVPVATMPAAQHLQAILLAQQDEFPWAEAPLRLLRERLVTASMLGVRELRLPPVLLVGPPGCGKSRFVRRLAQRLQIPYMPLSLAGAHDPKLLTGTGRGWATGEASPLVRLLLQHRTASAFVLLDELDKLGRNGESSSPIANQLLGLLEPETASRWRDGFLQANCDLSRVMFWGTANSLDGIGKPLLSRMELLVMRGPAREHLPGIATGIAADLEEEWQLPAGTLPPVPEAVWSVGADNLRTLRRALLEYLHQWVQLERQPERMH